MKKNDSYKQKVTTIKQRNPYCIEVELIVCLFLLYRTPIIVSSLIIDEKWRPHSCKDRVIILAQYPGV